MSYLKKRLPVWEYYLNELKIVKQLIQIKITGKFERRISDTEMGYFDSEDVSGYLLYKAYETMFSKKGQNTLQHSNVTVPNEFGAMVCAFNHRGRKVFKIARSFGEELAKVNLDLSASNIPMNKDFICIEFPDSIRFKSGYSSLYKSDLYIHSAFATVNTTDEWTLKLNPHAYKHSFVFWFPLYTPDGKVTVEIRAVTLGCYNDDEKFSEILARAKKRAPEISNEAVEYAFKCWVYIHSGDPDLREFKPVLPTYTTNRKKLERFHAANPQEALIPMTLVGFDFKKPIEYAVDMTTVSGHFRWQPWGARRERVKLIWIDAHERHYKPIPVLANP